MALQAWKNVVSRGEQAVTPRTLVEILGTERILVEHHRGIVSYGTEQILVGTTYGRLVVEGTKLRLCCMSREQLFLTGHFSSIQLEAGE